MVGVAASDVDDKDGEYKGEVVVAAESSETRSSAFADEKKIRPPRLFRSRDRQGDKIRLDHDGDVISF